VCEGGVLQSYAGLFPDECGVYEDVCGHYEEAARVRLGRYSRALHSWMSVVFTRVLLDGRRSKNHCSIFRSVFVSCWN
jgi:hypothetical protein